MDLGFSGEEFQDWMDLGKAIDDASEQIPCVNYPDLMHPENPQITMEIRLAKQLCSTCPVVAECAAYALKWEPSGIWGGLTAGERRQLRRRAA